MCSNWDGLNSGVFALRIHPWSVTLLSGVLAYPLYQQERQKSDRFRDQSAFQWLLSGSDSPLASTPMKGHEYWVEVPMRWFNSIPFNNAFNSKGAWILMNPMNEETFDKGTNEVFNDGNPPVVKPWKVMRGDLAVHFAGTTAADVRDSWIGPWLDRAEAQLPEWANATTKDVLREETREFWVRATERLRLGRTDPEAAAKMIAAEANRGAKDRAADNLNFAGEEKKVAVEPTHESGKPVLEKQVGPTPTTEPELVKESLPTPPVPTAPTKGVTAMFSDEEMKISLD
jgi:hypothetical protein